MSKDLFADLLSSANGGKPKKAANLQNLSLSERLNSPSPVSLNNGDGGSNKVNGNWTDDLDLLSQLSSSNSSTAGFNSSNNFNALPSSVRSSTLDHSNSSSNVSTIPAKSTNTGMTRGDDFDKLFDIFNKPTPSGNNLTEQRQPPAQQQQQVDTNNNSSEFSLLDGEFTDAFTRKPTPPVQQQSVSPVLDQTAPEMSRPPSQASSRTKMSKRDHALAELVDMGFPIEKANEALESTESGDDINEAISYLMNAAHSRSKPRQSSKRHEERHSSHGGEPEDFSAVVNDLSSQFMSTASFLFQSGKKKLADGLESYRNQQFEKNDNLPIWMKNQQKYKSKSTLTPEDEDYEEMDYESMKSIVEEQRMRQKRLRDEKRREQSSRFQDSRPERSSPQSSKYDEMPTRRRNEPRTTTPSASATPPLRESSSFSDRSEIPSRSSQAPSHSTPNLVQAQPVPDPVPTKLLSPDEALEQMFNAPAASATPSPASSTSSSFVQPSRLDQLRNSKGDESPMYVPSSRRRTATPQSRPSSTKPISLKLPNVTISPQQTSNFNESRTKAGELFKKGDFSEALTFYERALSILPAGHLLTIVAYSNLCVTYIKLGNSKDALDASNKGLELIEGICQGSYSELGTVDIEESKSIKSFWFKLLSKKAEACEHLERYKEALEAYNLVVEYGGSSKPVMDGRRRCMDVLQPKPAVRKPPQSPAATSTRGRQQQSRPTASSNSNEAVNRVKAQTAKEESFKNEKFQLHDQIEAKLQQWRAGKEDNLRALLSSLQIILWPEANWKQVTIADLVLDKRVKITYMKAVSKTHPDKIGNVDTEKKLIAQGVFVTLNQAWDKFKEMNNIP